MIIKTTRAIASSEITDEKIWFARRDILRLMASTAAMGFAGNSYAATPASMPVETKNANTLNKETVSNEALVSSYNNYYEFSYYKTEPADLAQALRIDPWSIEVAGLVEAPHIYSLDDLSRQFPSREHIYRLRCVEGWSAVIPWMGFSLADLLNQARPLSSAKFVKFSSILQPDVMPNQQDDRMLAWPYVEGLRLDEALHPLTILSTGMYGKSLYKQNGAPIRLVVPWKYGFKSIKSIVKIELTASPPVTSWNLAAPADYGFFANVNPGVSHPRWSQATERPLGSRFFTPRRQTELFNGYADQVAHLYTGMDLRYFY